MYRFFFIGAIKTSGKGPRAITVDHACMAINPQRQIKLAEYRKEPLAYIAF